MHVLTQPGIYRPVTFEYGLATHRKGPPTGQRIHGRRRVASDPMERGNTFRSQRIDERVQWPA